MKIASMNKDSDMSLLADGIFLELKNHGYINTDNQILQDFEIHVRKKRTKPQRYCIECGYKFRKGERGVPITQHNKENNSYKDCHLCKECYKERFRRDD